MRTVRDATIPTEGYRLSIAPDGIEIASSDDTGDFYARTTLAQLAEPRTDGTTNYPCCTISDSPHFRWRGCLVDEGRHFFGKAAIKKMIDAMAYNKLNVFHWHLTEDQGWRIDLKRWPELAKRGAVRDGYGPFCYSEDDISEIVEYAQAHHIKIVPELEIPGHSRAALAAFPEFSCLGERLERRPDTTWGVKRELYCAGNDAAIRFLEEVLDEFCRLFKYSDIIHIGGDECPKSRWRRCPKCQSRIKALGLKDENELQSWMMKHFATYLSNKGKRAVVWEEAVEGGLAGNAVVMAWLGKERAIDAAKNGAECIVCPRKLTYFDQKQGVPLDPWRADGKGLPLANVYAFDPQEGFPPEAASRVLGSEGLLWTEQIEEPEELMWMAFPRLSALAEALWTAPEKRNYAEFSDRLAVHVPRLRAMGVNSAPTPEGVPENRALAPAINTKAVGYDWMARHDYILDEARTWRTNPRIVFLGDGVFHRLAGMESIGETDDSLTLPRWKAMFSQGERVLNMSFAGDRVENILWRLENGEMKRVKPEKVVIMAGGENLRPDANGRVDSPEDIAQGVRKIVAHVRREQPKAEILLVGVAATDCAANQEPRLNALLSRIPSYESGSVTFYPAPQGGWDYDTLKNALNLYRHESAVTTTIEPDGTNDMTAVVMSAIDLARSAGGGKIVFAPGKYHFRSPVRLQVFISNHDNYDGHGFFLPVTNVANVAFKSSGARFICHGEGVAFALMDAKDVAVEGILFDYDRPRFSEWRIEGGRLKALPGGEYPCEVRDGFIFAVGPGWSEKQILAHFFDGATLHPLGTRRWDGAVDKVFDGFADGTVVVTRNGYRPNPCVLLYRATRTTFRKCGALAASGMGLLAQRCDTVTINGWRTRGTRLTGMQADATHFSNCRGTVTAENSVFEGMVDDAINVHSTALSIESVVSARRIVCRYRHHQSTGFEVFLPGERMRFIKADTMELGPEVVVAEARMRGEDVVEVGLSGDVPSGIGAGDAVENADWQPEVVFRRNVVRNSSPRATLFTTPHRVLCEETEFSDVAGAPILLAADATQWYETGACRDVQIRRNVFRRCATVGGKAQIQITPRVKNLAAQKKRYHRNIVVEDNLFEDFTKPLIHAVSVDGLRIKGNRIVRGCEKLSLTAADNVESQQSW